jgi:hypothetical protein
VAAGTNTTVRLASWCRCANGPLMAHSTVTGVGEPESNTRIPPLTWSWAVGAGDGNRNRMTSLEVRARRPACRRRPGPQLLAARTGCP